MTPETNAIFQVFRQTNKTTMNSFEIAFYILALGLVPDNLESSLIDHKWVDSIIQKEYSRCICKWLSNSILRAKR